MARELLADVAAINQVMGETTQDKSNGARHLSVGHQPIAVVDWFFFIVFKETGVHLATRTMLFLLKNSSPDNVGNIDTFCTCIHPTGGGVVHAEGGLWTCTSRILNALQGICDSASIGLHVTGWKTLFWCLNATKTMRATTHE